MLWKLGQSKVKCLEINMTDKTEEEKLVRLRLDNTNKKLISFVLNDDDPFLKKSVEKSDLIVRKYEPGFMQPTANNGRAHFCAPFKIIGNTEIDTFWFNIIVLWIVTLSLYIALYYNLLLKALNFSGNFRVPKKES